MSPVYTEIIIDKDLTAAEGGHHQP